MHEPCAPLLLTGLQPRNVAMALALRSGANVVVDTPTASVSREYLYVSNIVFNVLHSTC